jgi:tetratricopeptide (TPR) repeat protein
MAVSDLGEASFEEGAALFGLALSHNNEGKCAEAEVYGRRALTIFRAHGAERRRELMSCLTVLGVACHAQGKGADAESFYREAIQTWELLGKPKSKVIRAALARYGEIRAVQRRLPEAKSLLDMAIKLDEETLSSTDLARASTYNSYAHYLELAGEADNAISMHTKALSIWEAAGWPSDPNLLVAFKNFIGALQRRKRFADSEPILRQALKKCHEMFGENSRDAAVFLNDLALALSAQGRHDQATVAFKRAMATWEALEWPKDGGVDVLQKNLYRFALMNHDFPCAASVARSALAYARKHFGTQHPCLVEKLSNLGVVYREWRQLDVSANYFEQAVIMANSTLGQDHPKLALVLRNFAILRRAQGDPRDAKALEDHADRVSRRQSGERKRN